MSWKNLCGRVFAVFALLETLTFLSCGIDLARSETSDSEKFVGSLNKLFQLNDNNSQAVVIGSDVFVLNSVMLVGTGSKEAVTITIPEKITLVLNHNDKNLVLSSRSSSYPAKYIITGKGTLVCEAEGALTVDQAELTIEGAITLKANVSGAVTVTDFASSQLVIGSGVTVEQAAFDAFKGERISWMPGSAVAR